MVPDHPTPAEFEKLAKALAVAEQQGLIRRVPGLNIYQELRYLGASTNIPVNWSVTIWKKLNGKRTVDCDLDPWTLDQLASGKFEAFQTPAGKAELAIDDAGWGFPLGDALVGVSDGREVRVGAIAAVFFREAGPLDGGRAPKAYLDEYSRVGREVLGSFNAHPDTHYIRVCTGYLNRQLRDDLRRQKYTVFVTKIEGLLQDELEIKCAEHINRQLGSPLYYDPKEIMQRLGKAAGGREIARLYGNAQRFGASRPALIKWP